MGKKVDVVCKLDVMMYVYLHARMFIDTDAVHGFITDTS